MSALVQHAPAKRVSRRHLVAAAAALAAVASLTAGAGVGHAAAKPTLAQQQAAYCKAQGGAVQMRTAAYGTNNAAGLSLGAPVQFCRFVSKTDGSRIYVSAATLASKKPTIAALAYYNKPAMTSNDPNANPASVYCSQLGGTDSFGGINAQGGGWVNRSDKANPVLEACVFPDGSIIDSWGLAYRSTGAVRGKDLTQAFAYHPARIPNIF